jgi:hypothetical protein
MKTMLSIHPGRTPNVDERSDAAEALAVCAAYCSSCADACLSEEDVQALRRCIRTNLDCADICSAAARIVARQTAGDASMFSSLIASCIEACDRCAEECESHADVHEHCRACAIACRRCVEACRALLEAVMPSM